MIKNTLFSTLFFGQFVICFVFLSPILCADFGAGFGTLAQANTKSSTKTNPPKRITTTKSAKPTPPKTPQAKSQTTPSTTKTTQKNKKSKNEQAKSQESKQVKETKQTKESKQAQESKQKKEEKTPKEEKKSPKLPYSKKQLKELDMFLESLPKYTPKQIQEIDKEREILSTINHTQTTKEDKLKSLKPHCQKGSALACSSQENPNDFQKAQKMLQKECEAKPPNAKSGLYCARLADKYLLGKSKLQAFEKSCELGEPLGCLGAVSAKKTKKTKKYIIVAHAISENLCERGYGIYCGVVASVLSFKQSSGSLYYAKKGCEELHDRLTCAILERLENRPKSLGK